MVPTPGTQTIRDEPRFLHQGVWPEVAVGDQTVGARITFGGQSQSVETPGRVEAAEARSMDEAFSSETIGTDSGEIVTADQLAMAMDHWDPDEHGYPPTTKPPPTTTTLADMSGGLHARTTSDRIPAIASRQSLFLREIMDEYLTRVQTVEYIRGLQDDDSVLEVVLALEYYRQTGWSKEMVQVFPRECWLFWSEVGLDR